MQSLLSRRFGIGRERQARSRRLQPSVDGLETRALLAGSVIQSGCVVSVVPDATLHQNTAIVSYQTVGAAPKVDVQLNGVDNLFDRSSVSMVFFNGYGIASDMTFENDTYLLTVAYGGSGNNTFTGGSGTDEFIGGSGTNTFNAGTGFDILAGGSGTNVYNGSATGSGIILQAGSSNTINDPGSYMVY
jgi:Ca2+-binding RTX toxin-like protein